MQLVIDVADTLSGLVCFEFGSGAGLHKAVEGVEVLLGAFTLPPEPGLCALNLGYLRATASGFQGREFRIHLGDTGLGCGQFLGLAGGGKFSQCLPCANGTSLLYHQLLNETWRRDADFRVGKRLQPAVGGKRTGQTFTGGFGERDFREFGLVPVDEPAGYGHQGQQSEEFFHDNFAAQ